ncbi:MFS transporter [Gryllotalpicola protaetiae]|uniref:MFS transporter n=1 Tax=Gryllotalpicola protaetiae TaxID=2419771 RepID=A0A387BPK0_9MICO|nr:MFS transporter [Gryllotalpicola protaetiae]
MSVAPPSSKKTPHPSVVLTGFVLLVFCTGTAEYLVAGVLPQVAADLDVSVAVAGQTVTAYALGVAIGGPLVTVATARLPRKGLALSLGLLFVVGTILAAVAPGFVWLVVGRVVSACAQATLFAIALVTAAQAMGLARSGQAVAIVSSGLTVATMLGVPLGALLGGSTSWRVPFAIVAVVAALGVLLLAVAMPRTPAPQTGAGDEIRTLLRGPVLLAVATTVLGFAGVGMVFTYLVPLLTDVSGLAASLVPVLLLAYGAGGFAGNLIAGKLTDINLGATLRGVLVALVVTLAAFPLLASYPIPMVALTLVLGLLSTATIAPLQTLLLRHAGSAPSLALAVNVGAFNLANAIGSALGGIGVAVGLLRFGGFGGAVIALLGLLLAVLALHATPPAASTSFTQKEEHA